MEPDSEMGPLVTREHRDRVASYVERAPGEGATVVVDGRDSCPDGDGFFLGPSLIDNVTPAMDELPRRDLRPGARRHAGRHLRRGDQAREREPLRERHGDLHARRRRRPPVPVRRPGGHGRRSTCRFRSRSRTTASAAGRARSSATGTSTGRRGSTSTRARRSSPRAGPTRPPRRSISVPADPLTLYSWNIGSM